MTNKDPLKQIEEGKTSLTIMDDADRIYDSSVFYNPRMVINRDFTLLMLETIAKLDKKPLIYVDPLAGTGVRSFRILNELSSDVVEHLFISDKNPKAVGIIEENSTHHENKEKITIQRAEAFVLISQLMTEKIFPDVIDLDPFGSPVEFFEVSVKALRRKQGFLFATATDTQVLCGRYSEACFRIYNAHPTRYHLCHEVALRILLYNILISAGRLGLAIHPIISINHEHFLRVKVKILESKDKANLQHKEQGYVHFCPKCSYFDVKRIKQPFGLANCPICNSEIETAGPLWLGSLYDKKYLKTMITQLESTDLPTKMQIEKILKIMSEEEELPFFYFLPYVLRQLRKEGISRQQVIDGLRSEGFKASRTIFDPEGLKTDASYSELATILEKY